MLTNKYPKTIMTEKKLVHWVMLLTIHKELTLNPQNLYKKLYMVWSTCNSNIMGAGTGRWPEFAFCPWESSLENNRESDKQDNWCHPRAFVSNHVDTNKTHVHMQPITHREREILPMILKKYEMCVNMSKDVKAYILYTSDVLQDMEVG